MIIVNLVIIGPLVFDIICQTKVLIKTDERSMGQQNHWESFFGGRSYCMYFTVSLIWNKVLGRWKDGQMDQTIDTDTLRPTARNHTDQY